MVQNNTRILIKCNSLLWLNRPFDIRCSWNAESFQRIEIIQPQVILRQLIPLQSANTHQRPEAAKAEGKTETQKERETPARTGAPESETGHAEESAKSTGSARR